ncbi:GGDEF domain-containing protein [Shimia ponticola]|uniref:GGDEF domain-containing protein n=1 Tax=Shimia ponticola TaxID=2582893 RepID=UPI0011BE3A82|nr:GGDEF domain-containing protein [Shimia ponticola]
MLDQTLSAGGLDVLCPMHVAIDAQGRIKHVGPTVSKLAQGHSMIGDRFCNAFDLIRPSGVRDVADLLSYSGRSLQLRMRDRHQTRLKGVVVPQGDGALINMSFGFSLVDAVGHYALTSADFAATDLTIEMLYLVEAKSAAMDESRALNSRLQGAKIAAEEQAFTDTLTGLKNRRALDHVMGRLIAMRELFSCMHVDLDYFKSINDTLGHAAGDHVLQVVAQVLVSETRAQDTIARVGGDEFVILVHGMDDPETLNAIARRIIDKLEDPIPFEGHFCRISGSAGTSCSSSYAAPEADTILHHADVALYASKNAGRGRHTLFSDALLRLDTTQPTGDRGAAHPEADFTRF